MTTPEPVHPSDFTHAAVYVQDPADGSWSGEVAALGVSATGLTIDDARAALEEAATATATAMGPATIPAGIMEGCTTVADRFEVTVFLMATGPKKVISSRSRPTLGAQRSPYLDKHGAPLLRESVVLVIDELGSTSWMAHGLSANALSERAALLARTREWLGEGGLDRLEEIESVVVYTDNLVHGAPCDGPADATSRLGATLVAASHYQLELMLEGTILRGGIAMGSHHQSSTLVAGPALIEAHRLEGAVAVVPRVLLSRDALGVVGAGMREWAEPELSPYAAQLLVDEDAEVFVSYLNASEEYDRGISDQLLVIERHREAVRRGIRATRRRSKQRKKWLWIAAYHDHYVRSQGLPRRLRIRRFLRWRRVFTDLVTLLD